MNFFYLLLYLNQCLSTLSACLRQSILLIFPFWSGLDKTHIAGFFPVIDKTKSSRHSWAMSLRSFPSNLLAHFCLTSAFSDWKQKFYYDTLAWYFGSGLYFDKKSLQHLPQMSICLKYVSQNPLLIIFKGYIVGQFSF